MKTRKYRYGTMTTASEFTKRESRAGQPVRMVPKVDRVEKIRREILEMLRKAREKKP